MEILTSTEALDKVVSSKATFITHADEMYATIRNKKPADDVTYTDAVICERVGFVTLSSSTTKYAMFMNKGSYLADFFNSRYKTNILKFGKASAITILLPTELACSSKLGQDYVSNIKNNLQNLQAFTRKGMWRPTATIITTYKDRTS